MHDNSVHLLNTPTSLVCSLNAITQCVESHRNGNGPISCEETLTKCFRPLIKHLYCLSELDFTDLNQYTQYSSKDWHLLCQLLHQRYQSWWCHTAKTLHTLLVRWVIELSTQAATTCPTKPTINNQMRILWHILQSLTDRLKWPISPCKRNKRVLIV